MAKQSASMGRGRGGEGGGYARRTDFLDREEWKRALEAGKRAQPWSNTP